MKLYNPMYHYHSQTCKSNLVRSLVYGAFIGLIIALPVLAVAKY